MVLLSYFLVMSSNPLGLGIVSPSSRLNSFLIAVNNSLAGINHSYLVLYRLHK